MGVDCCQDFFLELKFRGGNCLCGEKKCENIQKTNKICYCLGGKFKT